MPCVMRDCHQSRRCPSPPACGLTPAPQLRSVRSPAPRANLPIIQADREPWLERWARRLGVWPVLRLLALAWWRWAGRELASWCPTHPDLPGIVLRIRDLERAQ